MPKPNRELTGKDKLLNNSMDDYIGIQNAFNIVKQQQNTKNKGWNSLVVDMSNCTLKIVNDRTFEITYHRIETGIPATMIKKLEEGYVAVDEIVKLLKSQLKEMKAKITFTEDKKKKYHNLEKHSRIMAATSHVFGGLKESAVARYYLRNSKVFTIDE